MSNYATLKSAIQSAVYTNGNGEITGAGLQAVLLQIVNTVGDGYVFKGVATAGTAADSPDANVFYIAPAGTYDNFGSSYTVPYGCIGVFSYDGSWAKTSVLIAGDVVNVSEGGTQHTFDTAVAAVPSVLRKSGVIVKYMDASNIWHLMQLRHTGWSKVIDRWVEINTNYQMDGVINKDVIFSQCTYTYNNQTYLWGNVDYVSRANYVRFKCRKYTGIHFLNVWKINVSTYATEFLFAINTEKYDDGEIVEYQFDDIKLGVNERLAIDGPLYYSQTSTSIPTDRFRIGKDGSNYQTETNTIAFCVGWKEQYSRQRRVQSSWCNVNVTTSSEYADIWGNLLYVPCAVGVRLYVNKTTSLTACKVYKVGLYSADVELIKVIDLTPYSDKQYIDVYFDQSVYFKKNEYMFISSPFYFIANAAWPYSRVRKYVGTDYHINVAANTFIGFMPIWTNDCVSDSELKLVGKKISIIGDSISTWSGEAGVSNPYYPTSNVTDKQSIWWEQLCDKAGATINRVNAIGGARVVGNATNQVPFCAPERYEALFSNGTTGDAPDAVFVLGGINDWNGAIPIGSYDEDYTGTYSTLTTFIPSYRKLLVGLQTTYPKADIYCLTPLKSFYGNVTTKYPPTKAGMKLTDYVDAIKECASLHGAACIDLYNDVQINETNISSVLVDLLHPKLLGQTMLANSVIKQL